MPVEPVYQIKVDEGEPDADRFDTRTLVARSISAADPRRALDAIREALSLWRGPALADLRGGDVSTRANPYDEERSATIEDAFDLELGLHDEVIPRIEACLLDDPAFYRQFSDLSGVVAALLEILVEELFSQAGEWFTDDDAAGSRDVIWENALRDGRAIKLRIGLFSAIVAASALDESLRAIWRQSVTQPWIDATVVAIRRDQAAGVVRSSLDADATALALTLMSEQLALEVIGRQDVEPEDYAAILTPIWTAVLFGTAHPDQTERSRT